MNAAVCDASILFKLVVTETDSQEAANLIRTTHIFLPELSFLEVGNALCSRIRKGELTADEAQRLLEDLENIRFDVRPASIKRALAISAALKHPIYDCLYLALAEELGVPLVTADNRFIAVIRRARWSSVDARLLSEFA